MTLICFQMPIFAETSEVFWLHWDSYLDGSELSWLHVLFETCILSKIAVQFSLGLGTRTITFSIFARFSPLWLSFLRKWRPEFSILASMECSLRFYNTALHGPRARTWKIKMPLWLIVWYCALIMSRPYPACKSRLALRPGILKRAGC